MGKYTYLMKNIGLMTLSNFATKLLSFFLVPLYTNILSTTEYGINDLFGTTIGILLPVLTVNIQESVLRFLLDKKYSRKAVTTIGIKYFLISNILVSALLIINHLLSINDIIKRYSIFFFLMYLTQSLSAILVAYIRGTDRVADLSISSVVSSSFTIGCNILFLVVFKFGLIGYFWANILGPASQCVYLIFRSDIRSNIALKEKFPQEKAVMVSYSKPMIANSIAWWINNASDKFIVTFFCGLAENGVYSVAAKIPSILNIFQGIFSQAWTLSAVKDFDPEDKNGFFANTYAIYNCFMVIVCSLIILFNKPLAYFLYAKDFYVAWMYVPWLTIAIVFGSLSGYLGGFFSAVRESKSYARSTIVGAVTNIILNIILIPSMGALGAAIATAICYWVTWWLRYIQSKKYIVLRVNIKRDYVSYILLALQAIILLQIEGNIVFLIEAILFLIIVLLYIKDFVQVIRKGINIIRH